MAQIVSAAYTKHGDIEVVVEETVDGEMVQTTYFVPDDMDNRHRQQLAEWEAEGNTIGAYVPPPPPTEDEIEDQEIAAISNTLKKVLFQYANWIRELKGLQPWTQEQFLAWVKSL